MRWADLFADLDAQLEALQRADFAAEVADRTRAEHGSLALVDRIRGAHGHRVGVRVAGAGRLDGTLEDVGVDWLLLGGPNQPQVLIALSAVLAVSGLGVATAPAVRPDRIHRQLDLRRALRGLAGRRAGVRLVLRDASILTGTVDRVGADFVELAEHPPGEPRRRGAVRAVQAVALSAVGAVVDLDGPA